MVKVIEDRSDVYIYKKCKLEQENETVASYHIAVRKFQEPCLLMMRHSAYIWIANDYAHQLYQV